jgi:hypothetical protein
MQTTYQARRISKRRADEVKKSGASTRAILLGTFNGFIIVEPTDSAMGDGEVLSEQDADYELQPVWHLGPKATLREARRRLGLDVGSVVGQLVGSSA